MMNEKLSVLGRRFLRAAAVGLVLASSAVASAATVSPNAVIVAVGVQSTTGYFRFASMPTECVTNSFSNFYIEPGHISGGNDAIVSRYFSEVTAAYLSGRPVKRVDYTQTGTGSCYVTLIEF